MPDKSAFIASKNFHHLTISSKRRSNFAHVVSIWAKVPGNLRQFAWRDTNDPYKLLIAELLLRRTNATAVTAAFAQFIKCFPNIKSFSNACTDDIERLILPIGLKWRANNIVELATYFGSSSNLQIPESLNELLNLPGVGPYVARAVLVNSRNLRMVPVDTNIVRITGRYFGFGISDNLRRHNVFQAFCDSLLLGVATTDPRIFNYALLDLASNYCKAVRPICCDCPLNKGCSFYQSNKE